MTKILNILKYNDWNVKVYVGFNGRWDTEEERIIDWKINLKKLCRRRCKEQEKIWKTERKEKIVRWPNKI